MNEKYLTYRGKLQSLASLGDRLAFVTQHPEGRPTALYRLEPIKAELSELPLPCGARSLAVESNDCWIGGDDRRIYHVSGNAKAAKPLDVSLPQPATSLVLLSQSRLGALSGKQVVIVDRTSGQATQTFELAEEGTAIAAHVDGEWFAVGTAKGDVTVFECEEKQAFQISEAAKLHEAAVTAILFETEELRFFSAGADQKLLRTHARGKLEAEDRGRGASHNDQVTAMLHVPGERFVSAGRDRTCKTWTLAGATRPATLSDGVPKVVSAALIETHDRPHLCLAGDDDTIRLFLLDAGGRFGAATHVFYDAYDRAANLLKSPDVASRGEALHALADYDDSRSVEMLAAHLKSETDAALRQQASTLLTKSQHPRAAVLLKPLLRHDDPQVRMTVFQGLRSWAAADDLTPLEAAIAAQQANIATAAVSALEPLAKKDDQARQLLIRTLDQEPAEVRRAALLSIEKLFSKSAPEPTLISSAASMADVRRLALIRAYQRGLLGNSRVQAAIRRGGEDADPAVRRTAFLVSLLSNKKLAEAIRQRDKVLHRQLHELETFELDGPATVTDPPPIKRTKIDLQPSDEEPLLSAISSRATDTCLLGACALASLGDARAFGTLLQLSREEDPQVRVHVCRALESLADARALQRLDSLVDDDAAEVRDAAFTAIISLRKPAPFDAAEAGLNSPHADVRSRGLQVLVKILRQSKSPEERERGSRLLLRGLNDEEPKVRSEAFKAALNLEIGGPGVDTLRFVLSSSHASVRREVLTEAMAESKQTWATDLLRDLLNDPNERIRHDAFEHLTAQSKGRDVEPMRAALHSKYADLRLAATKQLVELKTQAAQDALVVAIEDEEKEIRLAALKAMIDAGAVETLHRAMESEHVDVRLQAATARAFFRDPKSAAPLIAAATGPEPEKAEDRALWQQNVLSALQGLARLGDPQHLSQLIELTSSKHAEIRQQAALALAYSLRAEDADRATPLLQHDDEQVKYAVAFGLALCRLEIAKPLIFSERAAVLLDETAILMAAEAYGTASENRLAEFLDSAEPWIRNAALLTLLMRDWRQHDGTPRRILLALSCRSPRLRLWAARALEVFGDAVAYGRLLMELINHRGDDEPWTNSAETVSQIADLLNFGDAGFIQVFAPLAKPKQEDWDFLWGATQEVFRDEIMAAEKARRAPANKPPEVVSSAAELQQLAFGTYVGLVREQGGYHGRREKPSFGTTIRSVRQSAIRRLAELAEHDAAIQLAARPVIIQALGDPLQEVRQLAFEKLVVLGFDDAARAEAALESGHNDLALAGLKLLAEAAGVKGQQVLEDVMLQRSDDLVLDVARLLIERVGPVAASNSILQSPHPAARNWAVHALAGVWNQDPEPQQRLREATESRFENVRIEAACVLAANKDAHAFDALSRLLHEFDVPQQQQRIVNALVDLGDPRASDLLLDRLEHDAKKTAATSALLVGLGRLRHASAAPRLLTLLTDKLWKTAALRAVESISGYDQLILDPDDEPLDRKWMERQFPRHDDVLAMLLEKLDELGILKDWPHLIAAARWSLTPAVDPVLAKLTVTADATLRQRITEAIGWRLKHRGGPAESLETLLSHRDATTKFLAAEGLARSARNDGLSVLLSAVELLSDLHLRQRAVAALGELSDSRAWDVLLRIASDDVHALQQTAAEAIGHLGTSARAPEILKLLQRLAASGGSVEQGAIVGLRWLNVPAGWDLIRQRVADRGRYYHTALEQLGYNDNPATRDLLLQILAQGRFDPTALQSARRLFGEESLEPDYAALKCQYDPQHDEPDFGCLRRVCEHGQAERILDLLASPNREIHEALETHLMSLDPLPVEAAAASLDSPHGAVVDVAAHLIGRSADKDYGKSLAAVMDRWLDEWQQRREFTRRRVDAGSQGALDEATAVLQRLAWAAGRCGGAKKPLLAWISLETADHEFCPVRLAALRALGEFKLSKTDLDAITTQMQDSEFAIRQTAAELIATADASRGESLAEQAISDRSTIQRLVALAKAPPQSAFTAAVTNVHYQPIVLPFLIDTADVATLSQTARSEALNETVRLGAIEGLAKIATTDALASLEQVGTDASNSEDLRKAAWRGLRRAKRSIALRTNAKPR